MPSCAATQAAIRTNISTESTSGQSDQPSAITCSRGNHACQALHHRLDLLSRRASTKTEADGSHAHRGRHAQCFEDRRQLDPTRMTGRAGGGRHPVESRQYFSADATDKRDIERVGEPVLRIAVENHKVPEPPLQLAPEPVAQS